MSWRGPDRRAIGLSLAVHAVVIAPVVVFARTPEPIAFETVRIHLVSPPPTEAVEAAPQPAVTQPQPEPEPPQERVEPEVTAEEPPPKPPERKPPEQKVERPPETPPQTTSRTPPEDPTDAGGEGLNINTEGRDFPYPDYLNNVVIQVNRYFRWSDEGRPRGVVYFEILRDGSVRNIRMVRPSGNRRFDFAVLGAVETAGSRNAFGPLPDGFAAPTLPVQLEVEPPR